jgi:hypothetical protein
MSDAMTFGEIDGQEVELLPARTVLSFYGGHFDPFDYFDDFGHHNSEAEAFAFNFNDIDIDIDNDSEAEATGGSASLTDLGGDTGGDTGGA